MLRRPTAVRHTGRRARLRLRGGRSARARPRGADACGSLRRRRRHTVPPPAGRQPLEHAGRHPATRSGLGRLHRQHEPVDGPSRRLRHGVGGRAHRHPVRRRAGDAAQGPHPLHRLRRRERPGPLSRAAGCSGGGHGGTLRRRRPARARAGRRHQGALRALPRLQAGRRLLERQLRSGLRPGVKRAAPRRLDLGGRGWSSHPAGPREVRRDRGGGRAGPRAALHRGRHAARLCLPCDALRQRLHRPRPAADGPACAAARRLRRQRVPAGGADHPEGSEEVRDDGRRQRRRLVCGRRARRALGRRCTAFPGARHRGGLRGGRLARASARRLLRQPAGDGHGEGGCPLDARRRVLRRRRRVVDGDGRLRRRRAR